MPIDISSLVNNPNQTDQTGQPNKTDETDETDKTDKPDEIGQTYQTKKSTNKVLLEQTIFQDLTNNPISKVKSNLSASQRSKFPDYFNESFFMMDLFLT